MNQSRSLQQLLPGNAGNDEIVLSDLFAQLLARKWWIVAITFLGTLIGVFMGQLPPNTFQSAAVVQIERSAAAVRLPSELIGTLLGETVVESDTFSTEAHIIRSQIILRPVIEELSLHTRVIPAKAPVIGELLARRNLPLIGSLIPERYIRRGEFLEVTRFELPSGQETMSVTVTVGDEGKVVVVLPNGSRIDAEADTPIPLPRGGMLEIGAIGAPTGREFTVRRDVPRGATEQVASRLSIRERGASGIIDFGYTGPDPIEAMRIVNTVVQTYQGHNFGRRSAQIDRTIAFIEEQLPQLREEFRAASEALTEYRREQTGQELSLTTQRLLDQIVELETRIENIEFEREQLLLRLTESHPQYVALRADQDRLSARLAELRGLMGEVPEADQELARLTQQVDRARQLELQLNNRLEQLRILRASTISNIFILEHAERGRSIGPDRRMPVIVGSALGLLAAILGVFGVNFMRRGIEDAREIEALGLPVYATIEKSSDLVGITSSDSHYGLALEDPRSTTVEALRGLRTGLRFSLAATSSKALLITSPAPGDGKSFIALNLAVVTAQAGSRVLLIDADLRRGKLRNYFGIERNAFGLSDVLSGAANEADAIFHLDAADLDFMPTGAYPPNPAELLASPVFSGLLKRLSEYYDLIILDAPPVLAVADAGIIGQSVSTSLLIIRHLVTTGPELQSVQQSLQNSGVQLSGCVLNQFDQRASRYGSYGYKYGYYGSYRYKYD
jgi:tyrosine-protein kinase Etk/Wzc